MTKCLKKFSIGFDNGDIYNLQFTIYKFRSEFRKAGAVGGYEIYRVEGNFLNGGRFLDFAQIMT
jgi:hypothetical protein